MLVLTRKVGQEIVIGDNIRITVLRIDNRAVKLGIVAPDNVDVDRLEVRQSREQERRFTPPPQAIPALSL